MIIDIHGKSLEITQALRESVYAQFNKLEKFNHLTNKYSVVLFADGDEFVAESHAYVAGKSDVFASAKTSDMYNSIEELSLKTEAQLRKIKEKRTNIDRSTIVDAIETEEISVNESLQEFVNSTANLSAVERGQIFGK